MVGTINHDAGNLTGRYILGPDHELIACPDLLQWGTWMEENERHVAETDVGDKWVSTVFLGLNHQFYNGPPLVFETMVFKRKPNGELDMGGQDQFRYSNWDDAMAGHQAVVKRLQGVGTRVGKRGGDTPKVGSKNGGFA